MSYKEADRVGLIRAVVEKRMRQREAAKRLGIAPSQAVGSAISVGRSGGAGIGSSREAAEQCHWREVLALVRKRYADFGPTLACEKLVEVHGHRLSAETLRQMAKARRAVRVHPRRPRRACVGDLVQIDGSPHDWFEGRIVYVDDATSMAAAMRALAARYYSDERLKGKENELTAGGRSRRIHAGTRRRGSFRKCGCAGSMAAGTRTCRSSWRTSTGVSRWRRGTRRTRTGKCCTRPGSWT